MQIQEHHAASISLTSLTVSVCNLLPQEFFPSMIHRCQSRYIRVQVTGVEKHNTTINFQFAMIMTMKTSLSGIYSSVPLRRIEILIRQHNRVLFQESNSIADKLLHEKQFYGFCQYNSRYHIQSMQDNL